jgi:hypothetical protein
MEFLKKNLAILFAFILPIVLIAIVALSTYIPSLLLSTNYNFVYTSCTDETNYHYSYNCDSDLRKRYSVVGNKIVTNNVELALDSGNDKKIDANENYTAHIFLHNTAKNESREITFEEAQALTLNSLITSPDGVAVSSHYDRNGGEFFFIFGGGSSSYGYYLTKGKSRNKLNLINNTDQYYYRNNFQFVGWILPGRN